MSGAVSSMPWRRLVLPVLVAAAGFVLQALSIAVAEWLSLPLDGPWPQTLRTVTGIWGWLALSWVAARLLRLLLRGYPRLLTDLLVSLLFGAALIVITLFVFGLPATGLIATSSVLIAVLGFALRNIIGDVFSGIVLGIERPYRIGDWVEVTEGASGRVAEVSWRATRLVNIDGVSLVLPNGLIALHRLSNFSAEKGGPYRATLRVPMDPTLPPERVRRILLAAALEVEHTTPGLAPEVGLLEFANGMAVYVVRFTPPHFGREGPCRSAIATAVLRAVQRVGLGIAAPAQEVTTRSAAAAPRRRREYLLEHVDLFSPFTPAERLALADAMEVRSLTKGSFIVREGEIGQSLFLLAEGALEVTTVGDSGQNIVLDRILPGAVFGERSLLTGEPRSATITAATDVVLYEVRKEHLDPILQGRPEIAEGLGAVMAERQARNFSKRRAADLPAAPPPTTEDLLGRLRAFFRLDR